MPRLRWVLVPALRSPHSPTLPQAPPGQGRLPCALLSSPVTTADRSGPGQSVLEFSKQERYQPA